MSDQENPLNGETARMRVFAGHTSAVNDVAMPDDGRFVLTCGSDGTVRRWDMDAATEGGSAIVCSGKEFRCLAVTRDGKMAAAGDGKGGVQIFDPASAQMMRHWKAHKEEVDGVAFAAEGRELLTAAAEGVKRWDTHTAEEMEQLKSGTGLLLGLSGIAASADGSCVAVADLRGVEVWWTKRGQRRIHGPHYFPMSRPVLGNKGRMAFVGNMDGTVLQFDLEAGREVAVFEGHRGAVTGVAATEDGRFCASGGDDGTVRLWAVASGQCLAVLRGHEGRVTGVALSADGRRIASIGHDRTLRVWDMPETLLQGTAGLQRLGYVNAKVVLLGDSGVGKTGLALRLWHNEWKETASSHGMEVRRLVLSSLPAEPGVTREVWLWDLAGQPHYRLTHQLFMAQTSLALLVFDPQDDRVFETVAYWQSALRKVAEQRAVPGILVAARCDRPGLRVMREEVSEWARARGLEGPVLTAARLPEDTGTAELRALIERLLPWQYLPVRHTQANFPELKDAVLEVRGERAAAKGGVVVTPAQLEARVREARPALSFTAEDLRAVTGLLAGEGVLHELPYGDLVVLQPSWVNCYAATLLRMAGEGPAGLGVVPLAQVQPGRLPADGTDRLAEEDERQLLPALEALFLERELAWRQDTDDGVMLVFPSHVRRPREEAPPRGYTVRYRFKGPLEQIYSTLVVRLYYSKLFNSRRMKLYRQTADFRTTTGKLAALTMREEGENGELEIHFAKDLDVDVQGAFQRFVHDHLEAKAAPGSLERLRNYFCPKCGEEAGDRRAIDRALARGHKKMACAYCDPDKKPGIILLQDALEQQLTSKKAEEGAKQAGRNAREGITTASMEGVMVGEVQTIVFNADQIYRTVAEPDEGVDGEIQFRDERQRALAAGYRVQLKSGHSHLRPLKDGREVFRLKPHYEELWAGPGAVPVLLIIRTEDKDTGQPRLRCMDATAAIRAARRAKKARKAAPKKTAKGRKGKKAGALTQIDFTGEPFTEELVLRLREMRRAECAAGAAE